MADLVDKFYTADLSLDEEEALDALLGSSLEAANRFADKAAEAYARFGLPEPGFGSGSGRKFLLRWVYGFVLLSLAFLGWFGWRHHGLGIEKASTLNASATVPPGENANVMAPQTPVSSSIPAIQAPPSAMGHVPTSGTNPSNAGQGEWGLASKGTPEPLKTPGQKTRSRLKVQVEVAQEGPVAVRVLNAAGTPIKTLFSGTLPAGTYAFTWDGRLDNGREASPGTYRVETRTDSTVQTKEFLIENKGKSRE